MLSVTLEIYQTLYLSFNRNKIHTKATKKSVFWKEEGVEGTSKAIMPPLLQPRQLLWSSISATSSMVLTQVLTMPDHAKEAKIRLLLHQVLPPILLQNVLNCVLHQLAVHHPLSTSPSIISCLLRILAHPNITKLQLSDLSFAGTVELEALDKVESTLIQLLPSFGCLTHLDLSTHGQKVLSLRLGHDELTMSPTACDLLLFLVKGVHHLQELYLLVRSLGVTHNFIAALLATNSLPSLKVFIADAPRRTLAAPMLELNIETAYLIINTCPNLQILGNLICWNITPEEVAELQAMKRLCNFDLTILYKHSNKINDKFAN